MRRRELPEFRWRELPCRQGRAVRVFLAAADILHRSLAAALLCQAAKLVWRVCDVADGSPSLCIVLRCIIRSLRVSAQPIDLDQWYLNSGGAIE